MNEKEKEELIKKITEISNSIHRKTISSTNWIIVGGYYLDHKTDPADLPDHVKEFLNKINIKNGVSLPCNFDHNGECLICDCWPDACAYVRYLNKDYKYETKEELEAMFGEKHE